MEVLLLVVANFSRKNVADVKIIVYLCSRKKSKSQKVKGRKSKVKSRKAKGLTPKP